MTIQSAPAATVLVLGLLLSAPLTAQSNPRLLSKYVARSSDYTVPTSSPGSWTTVPQLSVQITVESTVWALIQSDGAFQPTSGGTGAVRIYHQAGSGAAFAPRGNLSAIDWSTNSAGADQPHCFNAIAAVLLEAGDGPRTHTIQLRARQGTAAYAIAKDSNLSVFVRPADQGLTTTISNTGPYTGLSNDTTQMCASPACSSCDCDEQANPVYYGNLIKYDVASISVPSVMTPIIALASGTAGPPPSTGKQGDAMLGLFVCDFAPYIVACPPATGTHAANFSVNDLYSGAELTAPLYCQGLVSDLPICEMVPIKLIASEFPWCKNSGAEYNTVEYGADATTTLIVLHSGLQVTGSSDLDTPWGSTCIASNCAAVDSSCNCTTSTPYGGCGPVNNNNTILQNDSVTIPVDHDGIVMFEFKARLQGDHCDGALTATAWLEIKEQSASTWTRVGSTAIQGLGGILGSGQYSSISQRTLCASYLAAGSNALEPGKTYSVRLVARCAPAMSAHVLHLALYNDRGVLVFFG